MKPPSFWYDHFNTPSPFRSLLSPLSKAYAFFAHKSFKNRAPHTIPVPVICIGNITVGGNGKTPCALAIMDILQHEKIGLSPVFLTRGYGGSIEGPELVDQSKNVQLWGDEALLLARKATTIVSKNKYAGAMHALHHDADIIVMDDGMQNYALKKEITFCIIDGQTAFGNGAVMPAGPLRQPLSDGISLADAFIIVGNDVQNIQPALPNKPVFHATLQADKKTLSQTTGPYVAFCGLGIPEKFKKTLQDNNIDIQDWATFPDHHRYTYNDIKKLMQRAATINARLITTEKDYVRIPNFPEKQFIDTLPVTLQFAEQNALIEFLKNRIKQT